VPKVGGGVAGHRKGLWQQMAISLSLLTPLSILMNLAALVSLYLVFLLFTFSSVPALDRSLCSFLVFGKGVHF
jgi:hypothetical protein